MALHSMTGFARKSAQHAQYSWSWEVRSVNAKGLDVRVRFPSGFDVLDLLVRKAVSNRFKRGSISLNLNLDRVTETAGYRVNQEMLDQLVTVMKTIQEKVPGAEAPRLDGLLSLRGVIETVEDEETEEQRQELVDAILNSLEPVLTDLSGNRAFEGERLYKILNDQIAHIET